MRTLFRLLFWSLASTLAFAAPAPVKWEGVREEHVMIPMRDGVRLSAYLYFPPGEGPWPVVFEQRYAVMNSTGTRQVSADLARAGFVVAMVNFRGSQLSEGHWVGYRALAWGEKRDGYDTCEWLGTQKWSTGKVGSFGSSQGGFAQNFLAVTRPPHLVCQYMVDTGLSLFQEGYRIGGVTRPNRFSEMFKVARDPADGPALLKEWEQHPHYDDYWRDEDCSLHFPEMNVPCFTIGSWYDFMVQGSIASFEGRQHRGGEQSRGAQQLVLGPWAHGRLNKTNKVGQMVYPENAAWPEREHMIRWFRHWLKGEANGVQGEPPVRYYTMGAVQEPSAPGNKWVEAKDWPVPSTPRSYYLREDGGLALEKSGEERAWSAYASDPRQPMGIAGRSFPGAMDARSFEEQHEVRTFTTAPLAEPVEWTGEVQAEIFVSSTARDTDFIARVSDVYPDGRSMLLMDYPLRARYREGFDRKRLLKPGEIAELKWRLGFTSIVFNRGHRIRITLASTGAPLYEPHSQTGGPQTADWLKTAVPAINRIWHDGAHASRIIAPVR